ncbi:hypothetical protein [Terribacillus sp. DMT04]|uniref:hypothetical protein n=1 Tax=Terribacillus sp. DMT04 TaxID=2850441 RepID=UPI001C2BB62E|nr:hypothetical protein [Terribacillus sp. DMT04]QXE01904.1 hypothetical protein KS242_01150 [Terribacillus sp. DMT04]
MKFDNQTRRLYVNVGIYVVLGGLSVLLYLLHDNLIITGVCMLVSYLISYSISNHFYPRSKDSIYPKD